MTALATVEVAEDRTELHLREAKSGSPEAFAALVRRHEAMVFSIARNTLRNDALAEELAQEIFLQLYRSITQIESPSHLLFWLRRVTSNRCIDQLRREKESQLDERLDFAAAAEPQGDPLLRRRLREAIAHLPPQQQLAVVLRYQEELEPSEISVMLDVPIGTIKSHLHRALAALRRRLGDVTLRVAGRPR